MELTIPTYQGTTQVNPDLGAAISKGNEANIFKAISNIGKQSASIEGDILSSNIADAKRVNAIKEEQAKALKELKDKNDKLLKDQQEFSDKANAKLESQDFDASIGSLSNVDKATQMHSKIQEVTKLANEGKLSQAYAESFNSSLYEKYGKYADEAQKDHNIEVVNSNSEKYSLLGDADKAKLIASLKDGGYSKDIIDGITIGGSVKQLINETKNKESLTPADAERIKAFTIDVKNKIAETGKDPESTPQIKSWLFQLNELEKNLSEQTVKNARLNYVKSLGDPKDLSSAFMVDMKLEDFNAMNPNDPSKAYTEFEAFQSKKENADKARDMVVNGDKYSQSEKDDMYSKNAAYKAYITPKTINAFVDAGKNGDYSEQNKIVLQNTTILKESVGKEINNILSSLSTVSKDTPEIVAQKQGALKSAISVFEVQRNSSNGVAATKALYGDNYKNLESISNISQYITNGDMLKAFDMNNQVQAKGLNTKIENNLETKIYKMLDNEPARDEIWNSLYVLNTVGSSALNESTVKSVIEKYHAGDIHTNKGEDDNVIVRSSGHSIDEAYAPYMNMYFKKNYPDAKTAIQKGNYMYVYNENGQSATIPMDIWKQNEQIWAKKAKDNAIEEGKLWTSKVSKFTSTTLANAYSRAVENYQGSTKKSPLPNFYTLVKNELSKDYSIVDKYIDTDEEMLKKQEYIYGTAAKDTTLNSNQREEMAFNAKKAKESVYKNQLAKPKYSQEELKKITDAAKELYNTPNLTDSEKKMIAEDLQRILKENL